MQLLFTISVALLAGLFMTRIARPLQFPDVTGYLIAGILIGPYLLGALGIPGLGLNSIAQVEEYHLFSDIALGFIAFAIGNEFRLSQMRQIGKKATVIGVLQAVITTVVVDIILICVHLLMPDVLPLSAAIILGAIAAATAPAATLMVVRQYKAKGALTDLLLPIVALDDAVGLVLFAISFGVARSLVNNETDLIGTLINPLIEIAASLVLGMVMGALLNWAERFFHSRSKRLAISVTAVLLTVAISMLHISFGAVTVSFSSMLTCMMLGTVFCNLCDFSEELMERCDRWTAPLYIIFFVLSGAELDFKMFSTIAIVCVGIIYILSRACGKYFGAYFSAKGTGCDKQTARYLGIALFPQAGVELGMSLQAEQALGEEGRIIRNIVLFSVMIFMLVAPSLSKFALTKAGDIQPQGRKSRRVKPDALSTSTDTTDDVASDK